MVGRKRKLGPRQPNGQLRRSRRKRVDPRDLTFQRTLRNAAEFKIGVELTGETGRLLFAGELTEVQAATASEVGETYGRYERLAGIRRLAKGFAYDAGYEVFDDLLLPQHRRERERLANEGRNRFKELQSILSHLSPEELAAVETLCVEDAHPLPIYYEQIRRVLDRVAEVWNVKRLKAASGRHAGKGAPEPRNRRDRDEDDED